MRKNLGKNICSLNIVKRSSKPRNETVTICKIKNVKCYCDNLRIENNVGI